MKRMREQIKTELMAEAEVVVDALLDRHESAEAPTLAEVEEVILGLRKRLSERMAEVVLGDQEAVQPVAAPLCPTCGREMEYKGQRGTTVESRLGTLRLKRAYYHCDRCEGGLFPPGSAVEVVGEELE
jgi:uncharacterized protein with PIN domain